MVATSTASTAGHRCGRPPMRPAVLARALWALAKLGLVMLPWMDR
jgi:hypothetical protein